MKENLAIDLAIKIYQELDIVRLLCRMSDFSIKNEADIPIHFYPLIFKDIYERSDRAAEMVEQLQEFSDE